MAQETSGQVKHKQRFLVVDDHEAILEGTVPALQAKYPDAEIVTAQDRQNAQSKMDLYHPELVVLDLSIPDQPHASANPEVGLQFLKTLMSSSRAPNILVLSTNVKPLVRLKPIINTYEGGFAAMDKTLPIKEMLKLVEVALRGSIYLPTQVRSRSEFDQKWLEVLTLKFQEGLTDKAIAQRIAVSDRTVRNYWIRIQDALGIYYDSEKDLQVQIQIEARKLGLID